MDRSISSLALLDATVRRQFENHHNVRMALEGDFLGIGRQRGDGGGQSGAAGRSSP